MTAAGPAPAGHRRGHELPTRIRTSARSSALAGSLAPCCSFPLLRAAAEAAERIGAAPGARALFSSDTFYDESNPNATLQKLGVLAVEMEAAALYLNAARAGKQALALCTISDNPFTGEGLSAKERQESFREMMEIALEIAL